MGILKFAQVTAALLLAVSVSAHAEEKEVKTHRVGTEISVMAYNVENFFDGVQDSKDDYVYIPLAQKQNAQHQALCAKENVEVYRDECNSLDWSPEVVQIKAERVAAVIASVNGGNGPDILILEEVENLNVVTKLMTEINKRIPADKAYSQAILLKGWDTRGINVGMISRLKQAKPASITPVAMNGKNLDTRGILHSVFVLPDGKKLNVFGLHFPSGGNPVVQREAAIKALNAELAKLGPNELAIAGGDTNINSKEDAQLKLFPQQLGDHWLVSHLIGCKQCVGTEYYGKDDEWSFLDALLFTKNMEPGNSGWTVDVSSIDVPNNGPEQTWKGRPDRFSPKFGVSDHWPIFAKIRLN